MLCVGYILSYRDPNYIRSHSLLQALGGFADVRVVIARNTSKGLWRYVETLRALRRMRAMNAPDVYLLGFRGHEIFWPVRWMTRGAPLVFDAFISPSAVLREENKAGPVGRLLAPLVHRIERRTLQRADLVLTDTRLQAEYFIQRFALPVAKVHALPVGAIEVDGICAQDAAAASEVFSVLFYGSFLPLHGVAVIVAAAARLADLPIRFDFVGGDTRQANQLRRRCAQSNLTRYTHRRWVPFEQLLQTEIPRASLCLGGPFGGTPQARRVVTGKTSQCLALGKATVIGRINEDYGFADRVNCLLVEQADAEALAAAIRWAYENRTQLPAIGARGRCLYGESLSISVVSARLRPVIDRVRASLSAK